MITLIPKKGYQVPLDQTEKKIINYYTTQSIQCDKSYSTHMGHQLTTVLADITYHAIDQLPTIKNKINNNYNIIINSESEYINDILQIIEYYFNMEGYNDEEVLDRFMHQFFRIIDIWLDNSDYDLITLLQNNLYRSFNIPPRCQRTIEERTNEFLEQYYILDNANTTQHNNMLYDLFEQYKNQIDTYLYHINQKFNN